MRLIRASGVSGDPIQAPDHVRIDGGILVALPQLVPHPICFFKIQRHRNDAELRMSALYRGEVKD